MAAAAATTGAINPTVEVVVSSTPTRDILTKATWTKAKAAEDRSGKVVDSEG